MTTQIVPGSISAVAKNNNTSLAQTFISVDCVVLVDTSGSMAATDSVGGRSRYDQACIELETLQANLPGKIGVISFANHAMFCPNGVPFNQRGSTNLADALKFAKIADVPDMRFIVISDGQPDDEHAALQAARGYKNRIDVIYVGPETLPTGRAFLERLAAASGGQAVTADRVKELSAAVQKLLVS